MRRLGDATAQHFERLWRQKRVEQLWEQQEGSGSGSEVSSAHSSVPSSQLGRPGCQSCRLLRGASGAGCRAALNRQMLGREARGVACVRFSRGALPMPQPPLQQLVCVVQGAGHRRQAGFRHGRSTWHLSCWPAPPPHPTPLFPAGGRRRGVGHIRHPHICHLGRRRLGGSGQLCCRGRGAHLGAPLPLACSACRTGAQVEGKGVAAFDLGSRDACTPRLCPPAPPLALPGAPLRRCGCRD